MSEAEKSTEIAEASEIESPMIEAPAETPSEKTEELTEESAGKQTINYDPFGDEPLDETLLMGVDDGTPDGESETEPESKPDEKPSEEGESDDDFESLDSESEPGEEEEAGSDESEADEKPPPKHVPLAALKEERDKRKAMSAELNDMRRELDALKEAGNEKSKPKEEEFKVLSEKEFDAMVEDDPQAALRYQAKLFQHTQQKQAQERAEREKGERAARDDAVVARAFEEARQAIPDLYKEGSKLGDQLMDYAVSNGFDQRGLAILTNPGTKVILAGFDEPVPLGDISVGFLKLLDNAYKASDTSDLEKQIEKKVTKKVTSEVMKKVKTGKPSHTSLGDAPGATDESMAPERRELSEKEMARLNEDELRHYMTYGVVGR